MTITAALITEGTYPLESGGVSVWCDQLIRGLNDINYHVMALGTAETPPASLTLPGNVRQLSLVSLWTAPRPGRLRPAQRRTFDALYAQLVESLVTRSPVQDANQYFTHALVELAHLAQHLPLDAALADPANVALILDLWHAHARRTGEEPQPGDLPRPTLRDALHASLWLMNLLRPLAHPLPGCQLTHAVSNGLSVLPAIATKALYGTPFILTEHGIYLRERYLAPPSPYLSGATRAFLLRFYDHLTRAAYDQADVISPASNFNVRWQLRLGADPTRIQPIRNGIEPSAFPAGDTDPKEPTVAWVGRIDPLKDLSTLIHAHALTQRRVPGARLRLYGPVPRGNEAYAQACRTLVQDLGLEDHATFEGRVPSVVDAYHSGHVVALSSISEGFPYTVLEGMATGRPVVATDVGGVSEAVGDTGIVVPARDPEAFADACNELLRDTRLRRRLGRQARDRVLSLFTVSQCTEAYRGVYTRITRRAALAPVRSLPLAGPAGGS
ncbi:GT4 family glycosyltransferase PelF [Deinococcus ficus]|uniref:DUF3492 domain-containing protein n=1 Tax=Deinococcus ficus TaxID=317577 RepID=A0A221T1E3_9DEIO|nr:GT4 family glycosyltransferase PelF [Deinococcus ficus]ASN82725.1 hypothetical protein DFI_16340 [Deinococcus ficus]